MSFIQRETVVVTTGADQTAVAYSPVMTGKIVSVRYVKGDFADGVDFTITSEATGETIWAQADVNASVTVAPRQATHSTAGAASLYASGGQAVNDMIAIAKDRIKISIAQGGDTKSGTFHFILE